ncbi:MAG: glycerol kinase GlpK [Bdellovibrionota bacterium]
MTDSPRYLLALDQGTTSSRALVYDLHGEEIASASVPLNVSFPQDGWVEQRPEEIWQTQFEALSEATKNIRAEHLWAIGISNQRETTIAWDRATGHAVAPAVVWQCRRSEEICRELRRDGLQPLIHGLTGLVIDAYFSATKIAWLLRHIPSLPERVAKNEIVFGTVDSWLLYQLGRLDGESVFLTDPTNASRTMLCDLNGTWNETLLGKFGLSREALCAIHPSAGYFTQTRIGSAVVPVTGVLGDQQASLLGHGCAQPSSVKCTFGTGAFLLMNTGTAQKQSTSGMLTTIASGFECDGELKLTYALEGSVFVAGSLLQWLRDKIGVVALASESEELAESVPDSGGVIVVPAFVGLGAPYWNADVRGAIFGLTRDTSKAHLVRAALEGVAHQVADLLDASEFSQVQKLKIDGGMSANRAFCQILADLTRREVEVAPSAELTAKGAALIAAVGANQRAEKPLEQFRTIESACTAWSVGGGRSYRPSLSDEAAKSARRLWTRAIRGLLAAAQS